MNFLKPTPEGVLAVLKRLALHYPRAKQVAVLDILAGDYAEAFRGLTMGQVREAAREAIATARFFPTAAQLLEAHEAVQARRRAEERRAAAEAYRLEAQEAGRWSPEKCERAKVLARQVLEAVKTGRPPGFLQELGAAGGEAKAPACGGAEAPAGGGAEAGGAAKAGGWATAPAGGADERKFPEGGGNP